MKLSICSVDIRLMFVTLFSFVLSSCSSEKNDLTLSKRVPIAIGQVNCAFGGEKIEVGYDRNKNLVLDTDEVIESKTTTNCRKGSDYLKIELIGRHASNIYSQNSTHESVYSDFTKQLYFTDRSENTIKRLDLSSLVDSAPVTDLDAYSLDNIPSVTVLSLKESFPSIHKVRAIATHGDLLAVMVGQKDAQDNRDYQTSQALFYRLTRDAKPTFIKSVTIGAHPNHAEFSVNGSKLLIAHRGKPNKDYSLDPAGTMGFISILNGTPSDQARLIDFSDYDQESSNEAKEKGNILIEGPNPTFVGDIEPESFTLTADGKRAYVSLTHNNAIAMVDLDNERIEKIWGLGLKNFGLPQNALDVSHKDNTVNIKPYLGLFGLYQPKGIATYQWQGNNYIVTANGGRYRDSSGFNNQTSVSELKLNTSHPQYHHASDPHVLGELFVHRTLGDEDNDGEHEKMITFGGRSFSIWNDKGEQVYDSGSDFERITAAIIGRHFNNQKRSNLGDSKSIDRGPHPKLVTIAHIGDKVYAFIGLRTTSGVLVYDITHPQRAVPIDYLVNRDFEQPITINKDGTYTGDVETAGDFSPSDLKYITADKSPTSSALLIVNNNVSGSISVYKLSENLSD